MSTFSQTIAGVNASVNISNDLVNSCTDVKGMRVLGKCNAAIVGTRLRLHSGGGHLG